MNNEADPGGYFGDTSEWSVGIGMGETTKPLPASTRAASGSAYLAARDAVENAKRAPGQIQVRSAPGHPDMGVLEAVIQGLYFVQRSRSHAGHEAVTFAREGHTGKATAAALNVSPQAVSTRLRIAGWDEEQALMAAVTALTSTLEPST